jgi:hypothetical protein
MATNPFRLNDLLQAYVGINPETGGSTPFQLTVAHHRTQIVNPSAPITIKLPSVGILAGDTWTITNRSLNKVTIQDSSGFYLYQVTQGTVSLTSLSSTPTGTGTWCVTGSAVVNTSYPLVLNGTGTGTYDVSHVSQQVVGDKIVLNGYIAFTGDGTGTSEVTLSVTGLTFVTNPPHYGPASAIRKTTNYVTPVRAAVSSSTTINFSVEQNDAASASPIIGTSVGNVTSGDIEYLVLEGVGIKCNELSLFP